ncbi:MAG: hypothetical protein AT714_03035 [Vulcanisaeta sp. OSP_8]|jgi:hypothetical protein|nr:MAG: hypothetical protein AT714_03035 [Vulcanisaeta sp. OSP_8]MDT7970126.1 DUF973 family protein [Vulcanisaeta sp.]
MSGPGPGDAKYYSLIYDGVSLLFTGVIFELVFGILVAIVTIAVVFGIVYSGLITNEDYLVNEVVHAAAIIGIVFGLINFIIIYVYYYRGFTKLAVADPSRYSIGRVGSIVNIVGQVIGISLAALLLSLTFNLSNVWMAYLMLSPGNIVDFVATVLIMNALYRLGNYFNVSYLSIGAVLAVFMAVISLFNMIPGASVVVGILGLLIGIPALILLMIGLNEVKKAVGGKLGQQQ